MPNRNSSFAPAASPFWLKAASLSVASLHLALASASAQAAETTVEYAPAELIYEDGESYPADHTVRFRVTEEVAHTIHPYIFGQFLERASWPVANPELGPEGVVDPETGELPRNVVAKLKELAPPIVRFPGGTDIDYLDWTDMIDNLPGREGGQGRPISPTRSGYPLTNVFGYDEYFGLREELGFEALLVVNFGDALHQKRTVEEAALHAAGLVAYCNAELGSELPEGMPDWPSIRAKNGHPEPYKVKYWQIGNELWFMFEEMLELGGPSAVAGAVRSYMQAMRAVDPDIEFILDGQLAGMDVDVLTDPYIRSNLRFVTFHTYGPWNMADLTLTDSENPTQDWWRQWVIQPAGRNHDGTPKALGQRDDYAVSLGYEIAATEWNWNGYGFGGLEPEAEVEPGVAKALGAASYIHGMMREAADIKLAAQSMLLGVTWGITAVRASPHGEEEFEPWFLPQAQATRFYSQNHGEQFLVVQTESVMPWFTAPKIKDRPKALHRANTIDLIATASDEAIYLHAINFHLTRDFTAQIDLSELGHLSPTATLKVLNGPLDKGFSENEEILKETVTELELDGDSLALVLPAHSMSVVKITKSRP